MIPAIEARNLTKRFGDVTALDDVSLTIRRDTITGLLGRNGAGKTVLMSLATAQESPSKGTIRLFGEDPRENASVLDKTCFIRDDQRYPDDFKLRQVLALGPHFYERWDDALARRVVEALDIPDGRDIRKLSRGQLSAVSILIGLASRAPITFFDEPYLGLDVTARTIFYDLLLEDYMAHPRTIVLSTHLIDEMEQLLEHVIILDRGTVREDASIDELRERAVLVSGPIDELDSLTAHVEVLRRQQMGRVGAVVVPADADLLSRAEAAGLAVQPASVHDLVAAYGLKSKESVR